MFFAYSKDKMATESRITLWERASKKLGRLVDRLRDRPICPPEMIYLWEIYIEIKQGCDFVTWEAIEAYKNATNELLTPYEAKSIMKIEQARKANV